MPLSDPEGNSIINEVYDLLDYAAINVSLIMKNPLHASLVVPIFVILTVTVWITNESANLTPAWAQSCEPQVVGLDTTFANSIVVPFFGRAWGQVFLAPDTLVKSITVWRRYHLEGVINLDPMHLYITKVDSTGRPLVEEVLLDGPSIVISTVGDGMTNDKVQYSFDPPFSLPEPGRYFFAIKEEWCDAHFILLSDSLDSYPDGKAWRIEPINFLCEGLGCCASGLGVNFDLIFEVEFCLLPTTDVPFPKEDSWGKIKADYR